MPGKGITGRPPRPTETHPEAACPSPSLVTPSRRDIHVDDGLLVRLGSAPQWRSSSHRRGSRGFASSRRQTVDAGVFRRLDADFNRCLWASQGSETDTPVRRQSILGDGSRRTSFASSPNPSIFAATPRRSDLAQSQPLPGSPLQGLKRTRSQVTKRKRRRRNEEGHSQPLDSPQLASTDDRPADDAETQDEEPRRARSDIVRLEQEDGHETQVETEPDLVVKEEEEQHGVRADVLPEPENVLQEQDNELPEQAEESTEQAEELPEQDNTGLEQDNNVLPEQDDVMLEEDNGLPEPDDAMLDRDDTLETLVETEEDQAIKVEEELEGTNGDVLAEHDIQHETQAVSDQDQAMQEDEGEEDDVSEYPVHKILRHRLDEDGSVHVLVQWGGRWLDGEPTWEPEDQIWETCREVVVKYWAPNGRSHRTRLLGLDPLLGPFTVCRIMGERKTRKKRGTVEKGGNGAEMKYLVDFVGYAKPEWQPAECLPAAMVKEWKMKSSSEGETET
ncbi:hypothetical protein EsH8_VII_000107 [Colletotrichum jinshuiense]